MSRSRDPSGEPAVLAVSPHACEWLSASAPPIRIDVPTSEPAVLVEAAEQAWRAAGGGHRKCILSLARPFVAHRVLELPPLSRAELQRVLERRARGLWEGRADGRPPLYTARELQRPGREGARRWLLVSVDDRPVRVLRRGLAERGLRVQRIVARDLAALESARQAAATEGEATIVIVVEDSAVTVALLSGTDIVQRDTIEGSLATRPALAGSLVHEVRTCAGIWRKESRGARVGHVVVFGLPRPRVELLGLSLAAVVPDAPVLAATPEGDATGSLGALDAARVRGPLNPELGFWMPLRRRTAGLVGALVGVAALSSAWVLFESGSTRIRELRAETRALLQRSDGLAELRARNLAARGEVELLEHHLARMDRVHSAGLDLDGLLVAIDDAFSGRARLRGISARRDVGGSARVVLEGSCDPDPARLVPRLREVLDDLQVSSGLADLRLSLPEDLSRGDRDEATFRISGRAGGDGR